jgi:hypothetical protein
MEDTNLIISRDLSLVMASREIWGQVNRDDPLSDYFKYFFFE